MPFPFFCSILDVDDKICLPAPADLFRRDRVHKSRPQGHGNGLRNAGYRACSERRAGSSWSINHCSR